ncbi:ogr/Delta-like zinc finger family protein [Microbulbifer sp. 2304DJ12-6]|uniref:ogr/Delta-like zinc finger family protein n=1 Tax=Microbulbifer sp. 2304DJ12-6 TaxID=3233340 RepID=UPI0039B0D2BB
METQAINETGPKPVMDTTPMRIGLCCPHCGAKARARTSQQITPLYREIYFQCTDVECGHTYVAALSVLHSLSLSAKPNPEVNIPLSPRIVRH